MVFVIVFWTTLLVLNLCSAAAHLVLGEYWWFLFNSLGVVLFYQILKDTLDAK
jgi:hypothetical protein